MVQTKTSDSKVIPKSSKGCQLRLRQNRWREKGGPSGGEAGWGGSIWRGWVRVCSPHRAPNRQRKPWRGQCSSAPGPRGRGVTWDLLHRWLHLLCHGSLNQEVQVPAGGIHYPLRENEKEDWISFNPELSATLNIKYRGLLE